METKLQDAGVVLSRGDRLSLMPIGRAADMSLDDALAMVREAGYRVSKPRAVAEERPATNALGLPRSPLYDPKYRMRYRTPTVAYGVSTAGQPHAFAAYLQVMQQRHGADWKPSWQS